MVDGVIRETVSRVPLAGAAVECGLFGGGELAQLLAQKFGEQVMVAIPAALSIARDQEHIALVKALECRASIRRVASGSWLYHRVAQLGAETLEDRGLCQEALNGFRLAIKDLVRQVINHVAMAVAKIVDKGLHRCRVAALQCVGRHLQARNPAFGAVFEGCDLRAGQGRVRLVGGKIRWLRLGENVNQRLAIRSTGAVRAAVPAAVAGRRDSTRSDATGAVRGLR